MAYQETNGLGSDAVAPKVFTYLVAYLRRFAIDVFLEDQTGKTAEFTIAIYGEFFFPVTISLPVYGFFHIFFSEYGRQNRAEHYPRFFCYWPVGS
ncbi:hypothetical protein FVB32_05935 [Flagellimonas hymeniacidonis]|uniref:Uncharacterized protein n=1 Tax=Flagellimonas hymeniacidonis TaxID=2603628 RepID=A0A5C8VAJ3_9FLAO|nr:hypothetical protein [Flagellimonas hymeniacidonis]TXN37828.1 hypothetical protein FVB32_05935 [Flagellimonas hymeniacidonis]